MDKNEKLPIKDIKNILSFAYILLYRKNILLNKKNMSIQKIKINLIYSQFYNGNFKIKNNRKDCWNSFKSAEKLIGKLIIFL